MPESVDVDVALHLDPNDLERAMSENIQELNSMFSESLNIMSQLKNALSDLTRPMDSLVSSAEKIKDAFSEVKDLTDRIRQDISSTRLQTGAPGTMGGGMGGGGGGLGNILGLLGGAGGPIGGIIAAGLSLAPVALGGGALAGAGSFAGLADMVGDRGSLLSRGAAFVGNTLGIGDPLSSVRGVVNGGQQQISPSQAIGAIARGDIGSAISMMARGGLDISGTARLAGGALGLVESMGQGPMGMLTHTLGRSMGAGGGAEVAQAMGMGRLGQGLGAMLGGAIMPGLTSSFMDQAMAAYPGYLQTMASMAEVGLAGGDVRTMRGLRPARFGYGPGEQGAAFGGLFRGFGGGALTEETQLTAMAYSRAYGVDMGAIGQSVGGLLNMGGGGQNFNAQIRETAMVRVMADAVSEGFGRRLPEFASAVGSGLSMLSQGPALIEQQSMPGLVSSLSRLMGRTSTAMGVGLEGAQRYMQPLISAPQRFLEGMMGGGGDPFQMALAWSTNRESVGSDPMEMVRRMVGVSQDPFSRESLEFQRAPIQAIMEQNQTRYSRLLALRQYMPDISAQGALRVVDRASDVIEGGGSLENVDMLELFTGVTDAQMSEGENTRQTMRDIQRSGEQIMRDQLGAMRASAGFQEQQLGIAAAGAEQARRAYNVQMGLQRAMAQLMSVSALGTAMQTLEQTYGSEFAAQLGGTGDGVAATQMFLRRTIETLQSFDLDPDELAQSLLNVERSSNPEAGEEGPLGRAELTEAQRAQTRAQRQANTGALNATNNHGRTNAVSE